MSVQTGDGKSQTPFGLCLDEAGFDGHSGRARFAVAVGVDAVTVWRWYTGRSAPSSQATRQAVAKRLKTSDAAVDQMFDAEAAA